MADYTGDEVGEALTRPPVPDPDDVFDIRPPGVPARAVPVMDDDIGAIVGYRDEPVTGVYKFYDLNGDMVGMSEKGLETPLFDPLDLIFFAGGILRSLGKGVVFGTVRTVPKVAATKAAMLASGALARTLVGAMRTTFKGLSVGALKFTATTATRMATKGRYVPMHILHLGLKYGKRVPDPQGVKGAFLYTTKMLRNGKEYTLEIVVREADWTVLHFLYR